MSGCAARSFEGRVYTSLQLSQITYKTSLNAAAQAYHDGALSKEQMDQIVGVAKKWQYTHNLVLSRTKDYLQLKDGVKRRELQFDILTLTQSLDKITLEFAILLKKPWNRSP